jgi:hypothetical protein
MKFSKWRKKVKRILYVLSALLIISCFGFGQTGSGKIIGKVADSEGTPLPGVTVTLTGEKIGKMVAVTAVNGHFRFLNLPVGKNYEVRCELGGFQTQITRGLEIWIGSTSEVNVVMELATLEEAVTIIATSPLVDTKSTTVARNITAEQVQLYPTSRNPWTVMMLAPGMLVDREDVGGSESGQQSAYFGHGGHEDDSTWRIDGANITDASAIGAAPAYLNSNAYEEMQISYGSNDITAQTGGVQLNFVTKRAGNTFRGTFHMFVEDDSWQFDNISKHPEAELAPGYVSPGIDRLYMYGADFGGPIIKDHIFFYGSWSIQDIHARTITGGLDETWLISGYGKVNWQYKGNMGDVFMAYDDKLKWNRTWIGAASQAPGTLWDQVTPGYIFRLADQQVIGDLLIQFRTIYTDGGFILDPRGNEVIGDTAVGDDWWIYYDPAYFWDGSIIHYETNRNQLNASLDLNYFAEGLLGGDHEIKFGIDYVSADTTSVTYYPNERTLYRSTDLGDPYFVYEAVSNFVFDVNMKRYSAYLSDTATFGRLSLMLGLRYDQEQAAHNAATAPGVSLEGTPIFTDYLGDLSGGERKIDQKWKVLSPRFSLTYDITGDGKNVVKLSLARYGSQVGNNLGFFQWTMKKRAIAVPWYDDGDMIPQLSEIDDTIDPMDAEWFEGFDPTDPYTLESTNRFDPDHNSPLMDELTVGYEREITTDFAASLSFFYKRRHRHILDIGILADGSIETPENWFVAGTDAITGSDYYERYEIPVAYYRTNTKNSYWRYLAGSLALKKRYSNKWMLDASFTLLSWKQFNDRSEWNAGVVIPAGYWDYYDGLDPTNFDYFNEAVVAPESSGSGVSEIFVNARWMFKLAGLYQLPYEINLSVVFSAREGYPVPYYADLSRGAGLPDARIMESGKKFGDDRLPAFWILNFGLEKIFRVGGNTSVALHVDAYNITNNATVLKKNPSLTGTTDQIQRFLNPTVFQFGIRFEF